MACNLAMSFLLWNDTSEINFFLITDRPDLIPSKLKGKIKVVSVLPGDLGEGFSSKLSMEKFSESNHTLFIDADCLIYGNLMPAFDTFKGNSVSAIGHKRYTGRDIGFCEDIAGLLKKTGIKYFPLICGSVYYFEKAEITSKIFSFANEMLPRYREIGLVHLRGKENEEPLIAIAMAKYNQIPLKDTGVIKADRMFYEFSQTNVIEGKAKLWNNEKIPVPEYSVLKLSLPLIVHFNAHFAESFEYKAEIVRLKKVFVEQKATRTANACAEVLVVWPGKMKKIIKDRLRPMYTLLFGYRKIKKLKRM